MAWSITVEKFFWVTDLKYGAWAYGAIMTIVSFYSIFISNLGWGGWLFFILGSVPMTVTFTYMLIKDSDAKLWFYVWINWYFTFFTFCLGSLQTIIQTVVLAIMISKAG